MAGKFEAHSTTFTQFERKSFTVTVTINHHCLKMKAHQYYNKLSSPRAGPKGVRAESARAFTGRRNSHSERGEDFLRGQPDFFTETAVTPERKVKKWFPRWEINCHAEG